jgi:hypothetical protein
MMVCARTSGELVSKPSAKRQRAPHRPSQGYDLRDGMICRIMVIALMVIFRVILTVDVVILKLVKKVLIGFASVYGAQKEKINFS